MIVPMQKVTILTSYKNSDDALRKIRKLGVIHIQHIQEPQAEGINYLKGRIKDTDKALSLIGAWKIEREEGRELDEERMVGGIKEIISLSEEKEKLHLRREELQREAVWFKEWGEVSISSLNTLNQAGIFIKLYICPKHLLKTISPNKTIQILKEKRLDVYLALISRNPKDSLGFLEVNIPQRTLNSLRKEEAAIDKELKDITKKLVRFSMFKESLLKYNRALSKKLEFYQVKFGMAKEEGFYYLSGFCPQSSMPSLYQLAQAQSWAVLSEPADNPQEVPTILKNPKWVEIIRPVFNFMEILPGYKEYDISFWFLLFFSIFFALLVGDAGYGLIFLLATFFAHRKSKTVYPELFFLFYVLSGITIIWGGATGAWFGMEASRAPLNLFVIERINSFVSDNQPFMIYLCFLLGAIQLTIAHGIIAFRFINSLFAGSQIGWIAIIWGLFFIAGKLILNKPLPQFLGSLFVIGGLLVILFSYPSRNIFKAALTSLINLPLKVINSFADVISYLRLFAVGYATVTIAVTFNQIAFTPGFNSIIGGLKTCLVLLVGHSLNIILSLLAVIVHGLRLNMLEFSSHLDMEWSGRKYKPFKE